MLTWEDARQRVQSYVEPIWPAGEGTLYVAPWGYEDVEAWWVVVGPEEWLVGEDPAFMPMDPPIYLVERATGQVLMVTYLEERDRLEAMVPVGEGHPPEE